MEKHDETNDIEIPRTPSIPGVCISWDEAKKRYGIIQGDEEQIKRVWEENDAQAYDYYWQCLLSF